MPPTRCAQGGFRLRPRTEIGDLQRAACGAILIPWLRCSTPIHKPREKWPEVEPSLGRAHTAKLAAHMSQTGHFQTKSEAASLPSIGPVLRGELIFWSARGVVARG